MGKRPRRVSSAVRPPIVIVPQGAGPNSPALFSISERGSDMTTDDQKEVNPMIEVNKTYDLLPGIDQQAYLEYSKRAIPTMLQAPGIVEIRVYHSLLGSPRGAPHFLDTFQVPDL